IVAAARELQSEFAQRYDAVEIRLIGKLINNNAFRESSIHDLTTLVPIAFALAMLCIGIFMSRGSRSVTTALTTSLAVLVIILFSYFQFQRGGDDKVRAMLASLKLSAQPVFLTSATTVFGFLSLNFSDSPPFQDLGNVVAIGVTFAWLFSMTLLPALVLLMPSGVSASVVDSRATHGGMSKLSALVIRHHRPLLYAGSALVILFSLLVPQNTLNDVWAEYF